MRNKNDITSQSDCLDNVVTDNDSKETIPKKSTPIKFEKKLSPIELTIGVIGLLLMLLQWIVGLNIMTLIGIIYLCITAATICLLIFLKKSISLWTIIGYIAVSFGIMTFYIFAGADAGWGGFTSALSGFFTGDHYLWQGQGNFGTRLAGNLLIFSPTFLILLGIYLIIDKWKCGDVKIKNALIKTSSVLLVGMSIILVFTTNLRAKPRVFDMSKGHDDYLNNVDKNVKSDNPNVLVILMDDLGYGDTSYNARKAGREPSFETPNIDWLAQSGTDFDNFYASYSVCSPSRFALLTGRYPYRGYADNVIYPTVNSLQPFASTRVFNSLEMGANCDGMLGDEITIAETMKSAGYATGCFGKWHLGDYGQYLPTNQGFDYFYGSHHVNDMAPFYHSTEEGGEYKISVGTESLDQGKATKLIHDQTTQWITQQAQQNNKFFAYYATPWPHHPLYASDQFRGSTGAGLYGDCIAEFDYYLGELFRTMDNLGILDDTLIVFTSDNGPALNGSTNEMRGAKYSAYEGGQKVPFYMRWGNNSNFSSGQANQALTVTAPATMIDIYPTLVDVCNIQDKSGNANYLPQDRYIDGVNMMPAILDKTNSTFLHTAANPILHMKRGKIKSVQYSLTRQEVLNSVQNYTNSTSNDIQTTAAANYAEMPLIKKYEYTTWKYFAHMKNDNPEFFPMKRKHWLICLTDDTSESYQRAGVFPDLANSSKQVMKDAEKSFRQNRRAINKEYYNKK